MIDSISYEDLKQTRRARTPHDFDRLPPHDEMSERASLGCVLLSAEVLNGYAERRFTGVQFYDLRHRQIFEAMAGLHDEGRPVDLIQLQERLRADGNLEKSGGLEYLMQLPEAAPSAANWPHYVDTVTEKYQLRRLIQSCTDIVARAYDGEGKINDLLLQAESDISRLVYRWSEQNKTERHIKEVLREVISDMENYSRGHGQIRGLTTGLNYLDEKILLGITGEYGYVVIGGRPGDGKTSLAMNIVEHVAMKHKWYTAKARENGEMALGGDTPPLQEGGTPEVEWVEHRGLPVGVFSLEMSTKSLGYRLVFGNAGVSQAAFRQGYMKNEDQKKLITAAGRLSESNIILDAEPRQTIGQIRAKARRWVKQYGVKLFVLDYLQLVRCDGRRHNDKRVDELNDISAEIMALRKELDVPWLVLCQMNRNIEQAESKRVPVLSDLKDCGAIEQDCDIAMFLYRPARTDKVKQEEEAIQAVAESKGWGWDATPQRLNIFTAKNRNGPTGSTDLLFQKNFCKFHDWHLWKVENEVEALKKGERRAALGLPSNEEMGLRKDD